MKMIQISTNADKIKIKSISSVKTFFMQNYHVISQKNNPSDVLALVPPGCRFQLCSAPLSLGPMPFCPSAVHVSWFLKLVPDILPAVYICVSLFPSCNYFWIKTAEISLSEKSPETSESQSMNGHLFFYRIKKFGFKKKLEQSEQKSTVFTRSHSDLLFETQWIPI